MKYTINSLPLAAFALAATLLSFSPAEASISTPTDNGAFQCTDATAYGKGILYKVYFEGTLVHASGHEVDPNSSGRAECKQTLVDEVCPFLKTFQALGDLTTIDVRYTFDSLYPPSSATEIYSCK